MTPMSVGFGLVGSRLPWLAPQATRGHCPSTHTSAVTMSRSRVDGNSAFHESARI